MPLTAPEFRMTAGSPDRMVVLVELPQEETRGLAIDAVYRARQRIPRVSGRTARRLEPISGEGYFGIYFPDAHVWFQEHGTAPRTMRSLAGKTIPMWVADHDGSLRNKNPKIKTRRTQDGRLQVLIFRKAAPLGARKRVVSRWGNSYLAPAAYPGAPGRINVRQRDGAIGAGNVGVRWRHPGLRATQDLNSALAETCFDAGLGIATVYAVDGAAWETLRTRRTV